MLNKPIIRQKKKADFAIHVKNVQHWRRVKEYLRELKIVSLNKRVNRDSIIGGYIWVINGYFFYGQRDAKELREKGIPIIKVAESKTDIDSDKYPLLSKVYQTKKEVYLAFGYKSSANYTDKIKRADALFKGVEETLQKFTQI